MGILKNVSRGGKQLRKKRTFKSSSKKVMTAGQVAKIARNVTLKVAETKSLFGYYNHTPIDNGWHASNLIYPMGQGTTSEQYLGEKVYLKNIRFKGLIWINQPGNNNHTRVGRIVVLATKKALTNGSAPITTSDICRAGYGNTIADHIDLHKVDLLYDKTFTLIPQQSGQVVQVPFDINVVINKTVYFDQENSGYLKNKNYYLCFTAMDGQVTSYPLNCKYNFSVNFKDE